MAAFAGLQETVARAQLQPSRASPLRTANQAPHAVRSGIVTLVAVKAMKVEEQSAEGMSAFGE